MKELELGLSLCGKKPINAFCDGDEEGLWKNSCTIVRVSDFPIVPPIATPISSSSSVSSSSCVGGASNTNSQGLVGWPPVRAFRMNNIANQYKDNASESNTSEQKKKGHSYSLRQKIMMGSKELGGRKNNADGSRFVKVKMDGDPIGRKVDLNAHESYETLALALEIMFYNASPHSMKALKLLDGSNEFALTYEDKDGDWMLVGDVPWSMFLDTVKRLRIMKISETSGPKLKLSFSHESAVLPT